MTRKKLIRTSAFSFVFAMGIVSLFSDMTHEGARSIYGAFLSLAGASAAVIGFVNGLGEFIGYSFRLFFGYWADKKGNYWMMSIVGYIINIVAIPLLALVPPNGWMLASILIVTERVGKAIRNPSKNTLVSFASSQIGSGKAFAVQEFMDQIGAFLGPVLLFAVLMIDRGQSLFHNYRLCFAFLAIPALLTLFFLLKAKSKYPHPEKFEAPTQNIEKTRITRPFVIYIIAISLFAFGFIDFPMITMHVAKQNLLNADYLPLLYAWAMLVDAFAALAFGWMYDKYGMKVLALSTLISSFFAIFVFHFSGLSYVLVGVTLWGIGMGAQESILKSAVATLIPSNKRSTGFGLFETAFGLFWFVGSWIMGILYDRSITEMIIVSVFAQLIATPFFFLISQKKGLGEQAKN